jgi:CHAD domain-containing protein
MSGEQTETAASSAPPQGIATHLREYLGEQHDRLVASLPRVLGEHDDEAVHDLRVALRRARSLLKPAREVLGKFHTDHVRTSLKSIADATGELRDEEVLDQTIRRLPLAGDAATERDGWIARRQERERALRQALFAQLQTGDLERALGELKALLTLPVRPSRDREAIHFARRAVRRARREVARHEHVALGDAEALHGLRILYKRLRYLAEGFRPLLAPEQAALASHAAKFQKILGEVHDLDVAQATVKADEGLAPGTRGPMLEAIEAERTRHVLDFAMRRARDKAEAEILQGAAPPDEKAAGPHGKKSAGPPAAKTTPPVAEKPTDPGTSSS